MPVPFAELGTGTAAPAPKKGGAVPFSELGATPEVAPAAAAAPGIWDTIKSKAGDLITAGEEDAADFAHGVLHPGDKDKFADQATPPEVQPTHTPPVVGAGPLGVPQLANARDIAARTPMQPSTGFEAGNAVREAATHPLETLVGADLPSQTKEKQATLERSAAAGNKMSQEALDVEQRAQTPLLQPSQTAAFQKVLDPKSQNIVSRVLTGGTKAVEALSAPDNLELLATLPLAPEDATQLISGVFGAQMVQGAGSSGYEALRAAHRGDYGEAAERGATALISAAMAAVSAKHAAGEHAPVPIEELGKPAPPVAAPEPAPAPEEARRPRVRLPSDPYILEKQPAPVPEDYIEGKPMTPWEMEQQRADDVVKRAKDELADEASRQQFTTIDRRAGIKANDDQLPEIQRASPPPTTRDVMLPGGGGVIRLPWDTAPTATVDGQTIRLPFASTPEVPRTAPLIRPMFTGVFPDLDQRLRNLTEPQKLLMAPIAEVAQASATLPEFLDKLTGKDEIDIAAAKLTPETVFEQAKDVGTGGEPIKAAPEQQNGGFSEKSPELTAGFNGSVAPADQPSDIGRTPIADLNLDPKRFQYKMNTDSQGATNLLKGNRWNDDLAGIVSTWRDPADGKLYVVNGHHRVALAKENGIADIPTRELKASTAESARSTGAMQNIAEGRGTAVDAAKFMRDKGMSVDDIQRMGISMGEATAAKGAALARLDPYIFDAVAQGKIPEGRGIAIGKATDNPATQEAIMKLIDKAEKSGKSVTNETVAELARFASNAPESTQTSMGLFGETHEVNSTALEKAEVSAYIQKQLRQEKATFAAVSSEARAKRLSEAGNTINAGENASRAEEAEQHLEVYRRLSERSGPIDSVLNQAAKEIADGASQSAVKQRAYESVRSEVAKALTGGEGRSDSGNATVGDGSPNSTSDNGADDGQGELGYRHAGFDPRPALKEAAALYREHVARPIQESLVGKWITRRPEVDRVDPDLAGQLNVYDNLHHYTKAKADAIIHDVLSPIYDEFGVTPKGKQLHEVTRDGEVLSKEEAFEAARAKERLLVLMADGDSRANLRENHPEEYQQAINDPAIQRALEIYHPIEQEISQQRAALGGTNIEGDYLKRVYDDYTAGINKPKVPEADRSFDALSRLVSEKSEAGPQFNQQRKANAEYYYENGLHEFGPSFGPKYLGTARRFGANEVVRQLAEHATPVAPGDELPASIDYNGKTFYRSDIAAEKRRTGSEPSAKSYDRFDPTQGQKFKTATQQYLAPADIVKEMNGTNEMPDTSAPGFKRWMQDNALSFGFGIPHAANLMRRFAQVTNLNPAEAGKVLFSPELRQRAANALADETANALAERGALRVGDDDKIKGYIEGNLNPLNWSDSYFRNAARHGGQSDGVTNVRSVAAAPLKIAQDIVSRFLSPGHKFLFDPQSFGGFGGLDQRVRIAAADYLKANNPDMNDTEIASTVNKAFGDYQRANWSNQQKMLSNFLFFPGFETSTFQWILDHPLKTAGAGAMANLLINRSLNLLSQNKDEDKNDLTSIHVGDRSIKAGLINEGMAMKLASPILEGIRSYALDEDTAARSLGNAAGKVPDVAKAFVDPLIPYIKLPLDFAYNKTVGRDLTKPEDKYTPGVLGNKANDKYATAVTSSLIPEFNSVAGATNKKGIDPLSLIGRLTGVTNRQVDGDARVSAAIGQAIIATKLFNEATKDGDPAKAKALLERDPDTVVYAAFSPALEQQSRRMKEWDQAAQLIDQSLSGDDRTKAMEQVSVAREQDMKVGDELADALHLAITKVHAARQNQQRTQGVR